MLTFHLSYRSRRSVYKVLARALVKPTESSCIGFHGDLNATYPVGKIDEDSARLIATTKEAMEAAIALVKPRALYRDIGNKIESIVKPQGFSIVRQYVGHGINQLVSRLEAVKSVANRSHAPVLSSSTPTIQALCTTETRKCQERWKSVNALLSSP
jgi:methionine aminopeptidase